MKIFSDQAKPSVKIILNTNKIYYQDESISPHFLYFRITKRKKIYHAEHAKHLALKDPLKTILERYYKMIVTNSKKLISLPPEQFLTHSNKKIRTLVKEWMQKRS